jgi:hypothetical protein
MGSDAIPHAGHYGIPADRLTKFPTVYSTYNLIRSEILLPDQSADLHTMIEPIQYQAKPNDEQR